MTPLELMDAPVKKQTPEEQIVLEQALRLVGDEYLFDKLICFQEDFQNLLDQDNIMFSPKRKKKLEMDYSFFLHKAGLNEAYVTDSINLAYDLMGN